MTQEDGYKYEGEWLRGKNIKQGKGIEVGPMGTIYEGYYVNNKRYGRGRLIGDGTRYVGQWLNDKRHGDGKYLSYQLVIKQHAERLTNQ